MEFDPRRRETSNNGQHGGCDLFDHGNPINAVASSGYTEAWRRMGQGTPRSKAILSISAHGFVPGPEVTISAAPTTIYDFGRFPSELHQVQYPAPGDAAPHWRAEFRNCVASQC